MSSYATKLIACIVGFSFFLSGCGGGGGGGSSSPESAPGDHPSVELTTDCSGSNCGAISPDQYLGTGIGVWRYLNERNVSVALPVTLNNVAKKTITLIYTNETGTPVTSFPRVSTVPTVSAQLLGDTLNEASLYNQIPKAIFEFDSSKELERALEDHADRPPFNGSQDASDPSINTPRDWRIMPADSFKTSSTLLKKIATGSTGQKFYYWVENGEYADRRITDALLDRLHADLDRVWPNMLNLAGQPWGPHSFSGILIPYNPAPPLHVVLVNFDHNNSPSGLLGYFWGYNNFLRDSPSSYCPGGDCKDSNEALSVYLDTETFYLSPHDYGYKQMISTLTHELTHMITYYQRNVLKNNNAYQTFLTEMTAMMMEDILATKLDSEYNEIRDTRFASWLTSNNFNCNLTLFGADCQNTLLGYSSSGSFGAYLLRQYGIAFYKQLIHDFSDRSDQVKILDHAIQTVTGDPAESFKRAVQRWSANIAQLPGSNLPDRFGYPERVDGDYTLTSYSGVFFTRRLPGSSPMTLQGYALFPFERRPSSSTYSETFVIPPGVSLTIVVK